MKIFNKTEKKVDYAIVNSVSEVCRYLRDYDVEEIEPVKGIGKEDLLMIHFYPKEEA